MIGLLIIGAVEFFAWVFFCRWVVEAVWRAILRNDHDN